MTQITLLNHHGGFVAEITLDPTVLPLVIIWQERGFLRYRTHQYWEIPIYLHKHE